QIWADFEIVFAFMPTCPPNGQVVSRPLLTLSDRNCYDLRISNIKVMQSTPATTWPGGVRPVGFNSILVYFTESPETRLASPGISKVTEVAVRFACADPSNLDTCRRNPSGATIE